MSVPSSPALAPLLEPGEVATLLYVDLATVARWTEGRRLIPVDGPGSQRRYAREEVLRLMVDIKRTRKRAAARVPRARRVSSAARDRGVLIAEAALDVTLMGEDVASAAALTAAAAVDARRARAQAARRAAELVADDAAQDVVASRFRADAAAGRVREAATRAAREERAAERAGGLTVEERAERTAVIVEAAAAAVVLETSALAETVARVVAMAAELVEAAGAVLERAIEAEVAATASALELRVLAAAALSAEDVAVRLERRAR